MGFFGNPFKVLGGVFTGKASPVGMARSAVQRLPGPLHKSSASASASASAPAQSTQSSMPDHGFPTYTPAPPGDWKTAGAFGNDTSYGTNMDMPLGQRLSSGGWDGSNY